MLAFVAKPGQGKTTNLTAYGLDDYERGHDIMANYAIKYPKGRGYGKVRPLDIDLLSDPKIELENITLLLQELWQWIDSRRSGSKQNVGMSRLFLQSRKRNMNVLGDGQGFSQFDTRFRDNCDLIGLCQKYDAHGRRLIDPRASPPGAYSRAEFYLPGEAFPIGRGPAFKLEEVGKYFNSHEIAQMEE